MFKEDIELAKKVRLNAYCPTSKFAVGAVLRTKDDKVYTGCNIENDGIQGICAERTAFAKAISEGEKEFKSITILGAPQDSKIFKECFPCGYCRQFMSEFVDKEFKIYVIGENDEVKEFTIDDLLPYGYDF